MEMSRMLVLVLLATALAEGKPKKYPQHTSKVHWKKEGECSRGPCAGFHSDENDDCISKCVSNACHAEVFGEEPLEPGEVDRVRQSRFNACVRKEQDEESKRIAEERRSQNSGK
mmetsp:Transcript_48347/g.105412  ORF Transcript_48347/g.105412 Transcript_48347/m.105412 type:complete len:114 (-) Transcript_48347:8-349(-)